MRRVLGFITLAICAGFLFAALDELDEVKWRERLLTERVAVAKAEQDVLKGERGASDTVVKLGAGVSTARIDARRLRRAVEPITGRIVFLAIGAVVGFITWVWPRRREAAEQRSLGAATHATQAAVSVGDTDGVSSDEGIEFIDGVAKPTATETACQVCGEPLVGGVVACEKCGTPHHRDCWEWNRGCTTFGCGATEYRC